MSLRITQKIALFSIILLAGFTILPLSATSIFTTDSIGSSSNTGFLFVTNNTERMVIDANGNLGLGIASPGVYKFYANGDAYISGSLAILGKLYVDTIVNRTVTNISVSGGLLPDSAAPLSVRELGSNSTRWNNLYLSGQVTLGGGSPAAGKVLVSSDANGLGTWVWASATVWTLSGNTVGANDFIGSTNSQDVVFKTNNVERFKVSKEGNIFGLGYDTTGFTGANNIAFGVGAGYGMIGNYNIALGGDYNGGSASGSYNTFLGGYGAGDSLKGDYNFVAGGLYPGLNLNGSYNTALGGSRAGRSMYGTNNTAIGGNEAGYFMTGSNNAAFGGQSAGLLMNGLSNVAVGGQYTGWGMSGSYNLALGGAGAGTGMTSGSHNIYMGSYAIGNIGQSNQFSIGNVIYGSGMGTGGLANGMVGIGTMTPTSKLDVVGTGSFQNLKILSGASNGYVLTSDVTGNARWAAAAGGGWGLTGNTGTAAGTNYIGTNDSQDLVFKTDNTETMRIFSVITGSGILYQYTGGDALINDITVGRGPGQQTSNTVLGSYAMSSNLFSGNNTAIGRYSLYSITAGGGGNVAIGNDSLYSTTFGNYNVAVGISALKGNTSGSVNTSIGSNSMYSNTTGGSNVAVGSSSLYYNTGGAQNTAVGHSALWQNTEGYYNVALGSNALLRNTIGSGNVALGYDALRESTGSSYQTAIGYNALRNNTSGEGNVALGSESLYANTTGYQNTAVGRSALESNINGGNNSAFGNAALYALTGSASDNTAVGFSAGFTTTTGENNTLIGSLAGSGLTTGSNNIAIGYNSTLNPATSNQLNIGNGIFGLNMGQGTTQRILVYNDLPSFTPDMAFTVFAPRYSNNYPVTFALTDSSPMDQYVGGGIEFSGDDGTIPNRTFALIQGAKSNDTSGNKDGMLRFFVRRESDDSAPEYMRINASGSVGIATTDPTSKLDVAGTGTFQGLKILSGASNGYVLTSDANGNARWATVNSGTGWGFSGNVVGANDFIGSTNGQDVIIKANNSERLRISGSGNILGGLYNSSFGELVNSVAIGRSAGIAMSGAYNTAIGGESAGGLSQGFYNTSIGGRYPGWNMSGSHNSAVGGYQAGAYMSGSYNSAFGGRATGGYIGGSYNSAFGGFGIGIFLNGNYNSTFGGSYAGNYMGGQYNSSLGGLRSGGFMSGSYNVAIGSYAGTGMTSGDNNIYIGSYAVGNAGQSDQFSIGNVIYGSGMGTGGLSNGSVGIGTITPTSKLDVVGTGTFQNLKILSGASNGYVLTSDANGNARWAAAGGSSNSWTLSGNSIGVNDFIGSTNNQDVVLKANNLEKIRIYSGATNKSIYLSGNVGIGMEPTLSDRLSLIGRLNIDYGIGNNNLAIGVNALSGSSTDSEDNLAIGYNSLVSLDNGGSNIAIGNSTLSSNVSSSNNTAIGAFVLRYNTLGESNTAIGAGAMTENTIGNGNTAVGAGALAQNTIGEGNTAYGYAASTKTISGSLNTALGNNALYWNDSGSGNIAIGAYALYYATGSNFQIGIGYQALQNSTTGARNLAIGYQAGSGITTGSDNLVIGYNAQILSPTLSNQLNIGNWIYGSGGNIGIGVTMPSEKLSVSGSVLADAYLYTSDQRLKTNISTLSDTDAILSKLRGVSFDWISTGRGDIGFIAQEVEEVLPELVHTNPNNGLKSVEYANIVPILVEGYKNEKARADDLEIRMKALEERLDLLELSTQ